MIASMSKNKITEAVTESHTRGISPLISGAVLLHGRTIVDVHNFTSASNGCAMPCFGRNA